MTGTVVIAFPRAATRLAELRAPDAAPSLPDLLRDRAAVVQTWRAALADLTLGLAALTHSLECCREALVELDCLTLTLRETS